VFGILFLLQLILKLGKDSDWKSWGNEYKIEDVDDAFSLEMTICRPNQSAIYLHIYCLFGHLIAALCRRISMDRHPFRQMVPVLSAYHKFFTHYLCCEGGGTSGRTPHACYVYRQVELKVYTLPRNHLPSAR
jgi:hypothetical protein